MNPDFQYGQPAVPNPPQLPQQPPVGAPVPPSYPYVQPQPRRKPSKKWLILTIVFITTTLIALGAAGWALYNYLDQKNNVDIKVAAAEAEATKLQADKDAADFLEKEKQPNRLFTGPEDYGLLSFDYPKTWSIYVDSDASSSTSYKAYFNPVSVPPVADATQYALRVIIEQKDSDKVIASYDNLVKKGDLTVSLVKVNGIDGTRLDGSFTKDIRGSAVVFKIRDKTVTVRTDAETFKTDFDALISTIEFNK